MNNANKLITLSTMLIIAILCSQIIFAIDSKTGNGLTGNVVAAPTNTNSGLTNPTPRTTTSNSAYAVDAQGYAILASLAPTNLGCTWTEWKNRDTPAGTGDWETLADFTGVCKNPVAIDCKTTDGIDFRDAGQKVTCTTALGLTCINANNPTLCKDYQVRFCCPITPPTPTCTDSDGGLNYSTPGDVLGKLSVNGEDMRIYDSCTSSRDLREMYCDSASGLIKNESYTCPAGCIYETRACAPTNDTISILNPNITLTMKENDTINFSNKIVTLARIGTFAIVISVNNTLVTINENVTKTVNGIRVRVDKIYTQYNQNYNATTGYAATITLMTLVQCYVNSDCGNSSTIEYCSDNKTVCTSSMTYTCNNQGTTDATCSANGGEVCYQCANIYNCKDGACINGNPITPDFTLFQAPLVSIDMAVIKLNGQDISVSVPLRNNLGTGITFGNFGTELSGSLGGEITCSKGLSITAEMNQQQIAATTNVPNGGTFIIKWTCRGVNQPIAIGYKLNLTLQFSYINAETLQTREQYGVVYGPITEDQAQPCTDSDGGLNYTIKGTTYGRLPSPGTVYGSATDSCARFGNSTLDTLEYNMNSCTGSDCGIEEYYCEYSTQLSTQYVGKSNSYCPNGCKDGACLPEIAYVPFTIGVADDTPAADKIIESDVYRLLISNNLVSPQTTSMTKLFSQINALDLDNKVTLAIYNGAAVIIVGVNSPETYKSFASSVAYILYKYNNIDAKIILSSEMASSDLRDLFVVLVPCKDDDNTPDIKMTYIGPGDTTADKYPSLFTKGMATGTYSASNINVIYGTEPNPTIAKISPYNYSVYYDHCASETQLNEGFCSNGKLESYGLQCPNGCKDGACLKEPIVPVTCTDSDGGLNYTARGIVTLSNVQGVNTDYCIPNPDPTQPSVTLNEFYCYGLLVGVQYYNCPTGNVCVDGACVATKPISNYTYLSKTLRMNVGASTEFNGKKVNLVRLSTASAVIGVDNVLSVVNQNTTKTINGIRVTIGEILVKRVATKTRFGTTYTLTPYAATIKLETQPVIVN